MASLLRLVLVFLLGSYAVVVVVWVAIMVAAAAA